MSQQREEIQRLSLLVKQRDQEIGIMLSYLNKKKAQEGQMTDLPVHRADASNGFGHQSSPRTGKEEERKTNGPTLFQMMSGGKDPYAPGAIGQKSIKDRRIEFELNQANATAAAN